MTKMNQEVRQEVQVHRAKGRLTHVRVRGLMSILDLLYFRSPHRKPPLAHERKASKGPADTAGSGKSTVCKIIGPPPKFDEILGGTQVDGCRRTCVKTLIEEEFEGCEQSDSRGQCHRKRNVRGQSRRATTSKTKRCHQPLSLDQGDDHNHLENVKNWEFDRPCPLINTGKGFGNALSPRHKIDTAGKTFHQNQITLSQAEGRLRGSVKPSLCQHPIPGGHEELVNIIQSCSVTEQLSITLSSVLMRSDTANSQNTSVVGGGYDCAKICRRSFLSSIRRRLRSAISFGKLRSYVEKDTRRIRAEEGSRKYNAVNRVAELTASRINSEAKKHLSEMLLSSGEEEGPETLKAVSSGKLGQILSLPEFSCYSPPGSPVKFPMQVEKISESNNPVAPAEHTLETEPSIHGIVAEEEIAGASIDHTNLNENTGLSDEDHENCRTPYLCADEKVSEQLHVRKDFDHEEDLVPCLSQPSASSTAMVKAGDPETGIDNGERPSPVSVLETLFIEDDYSSAVIISKSREHPIRMLQINFEDRDEFTDALGVLNKEAVIGCVKAVLHTLELNWDQPYLKYLSSDKLLKMELILGLDFFRDSFLCGKKLLLDCINEVLLEFCDQYSVLACFYFNNKIDAIHKVCERVYWHLLQPPHPRTLEQIVRKDLSGWEMWMNLNLELEDLGDDISEIILEEMIWETLCEHYEWGHGD
ncbi:hypothetical protein SAY86_020100 [Trapa natans]|uniref:DUF4378 domain-containing protein n=1 Tax=Trapa natans TaxID=22666 RepID=A0AAN7M2F6_TRANT|nr:hypothetical protein SAY86_020100 [Trapa natans]